MKDTNKVAYTEYCFFFDTTSSGVWTNLFDFEKSLAKFFESFGIEATTINPVKGYPSGKKIIYLTKTQIIPVTPPQPKSANNSNIDSAQKLKAIAGESQNKKPQGKMNTSVINKPQRVKKRLFFKEGKLFAKGTYPKKFT